jgi:hypothetical protein
MPGQQTNDSIITHPEYARTYHHYLQHGSSPEDAARLAHEHTRQFLAAGPPTAAAPPAAVAPPKKKSKAKVVLAVVGAVVLIAIVSNAMSGGEPKPATDTTAAGDSSAAKPAPGKPKPAVKAKAAGIGAPVRDGKFEFVVLSQKCGVAKVGNQYIGETAQGQFCLVTMTVKNIGDKSQMFDSSSQKAFNASGQEYSADSGASLYANEGTATFLNEINPGNQVKGTVVFDIPKGASLTKLELHDSPFSGGIGVALK